ncbi:uncharacterized protein LOC124156641 [Ischnura elegans]|uniref:uncharacterized protein LOC124156641 n=1 Tax=Ischnura elegans TaxID=197161 RepID=UPI001ED891B7|nr:uncharacterized protein LOC124156641 [Ischnura elegans]
MSVPQYPTKVVQVVAESTIDAAALMQITHLTGLKITITIFKKPAQPVQCHRCQAIGHTKNFCNLPPKCVRCGEGHVSAEWKKTTETPATCALCGNAHTATYSGCEKHRAAKAAMTARRSTPATNSLPAPESPPLLRSFAAAANPQQFPSLTNDLPADQPSDPNDLTSCLHHHRQNDPSSHNNAALESLEGKAEVDGNDTRPESVDIVVEASAEEPPVNANVIADDVFLVDVHEKQLQDNIVEPVQEDLDVSSPALVETMASSVETQTPPSLSFSSPRKAVLRRKVKALQASAARLKKKLDLEERSTKVDLNSFPLMCDLLLPPEIASFVKIQADLYKRKKQGYRYSNAVKQLALQVYFSSTSAYTVLQQTFMLPSLRSLRRYTEGFNYRPGLNDSLFAALKCKSDTLSHLSKFCALSIDEMSLKSNLFYDINNDDIIGFEDDGENKALSPAKNALVVMARGIYSPWKQPIAYFFVGSSCKAKALYEILMKCIEALFNIGLNVVSITSDMGSNFVQLSKILGITREKPFFSFNGSDIVYIFDPPHLLKSLRNNLIKYDFHFYDKVASWSDIRALYNQDKNVNLRLISKISDAHIQPNNFQKMKVKFASQITISSLLHLWRQLKISGFSFLLTRRLNQDCLENYFGSVRRVGGNSINPTPVQFKRAFKKLFVLRYLHSRGTGNCEAVPEKVFTLLNERVANVNVAEGKKEVLVAEPLLIENEMHKVDLPFTNAVKYVSGYLAKCCLGRHSCSNCRSYLNRNGQNVDMASIFCRNKAYKSDGRTIYGGLLMPDNGFVKFVENMEKVFAKRLEQLALRNNIGHMMVKSIIKNIPFHPPCDKFDKVFLVKLFVRMRLYHAIKFFNRDLSSGSFSKRRKFTIIRNL